MSPVTSLDDLADVDPPQLDAVVVVDDARDLSAELGLVHLLGARRHVEQRIRGERRVVVDGADEQVGELLARTLRHASRRGRSR